MTTYMNSACTCAVCGSTRTYIVIASTSCFGYSDLDFRPAPLERYTLHARVHTCPVCGYAASSVESKTSVTRKWLMQESYVNCEGIPFVSETARAFYQSYMIRLHDGETEKAADALLCCAWACDDADDAANALTVRSLAADLYAQVMKSNNHEALKCLHMDLLRRSAQFERLLQEYDGTRFEDEVYGKIAAYEKQLAAAHDAQCHSAEEALSPR